MPFFGCPKGETVDTFKESNGVLCFFGIFFTKKGAACWETPKNCF